jgi:hypothetical protein
LELKNRFSALSHSSETNAESAWKDAKDRYLNTSEKTLGFRNRLQREWMTENTWEEIRKKAKSHLNQCRTCQQKAKAQAEYTEIDKRVKKSVRKDKRQWVDDLAQKAEEAQKKGDIKELYNITRKLSWKGLSRNTKPVRNKKSEILSTQEQQLQRWMEHFSEILNREQETQRQKEEIISERNVLPDPKINVDPPIWAEVRAAIKQMKS